MKFQEFVFDTAKFFFGIGITFMLFGLSESGIVGENMPEIYLLVGGVVTTVAVSLLVYLNIDGFPIEEE